MQYRKTPSQMLRTFMILTNAVGRIFSVLLVIVMSAMPLAPVFGAEEDPQAPASVIEEQSEDSGTKVKEEVTETADETAEVITEPQIEKDTIEERVDENELKVTPIVDEIDSEGDETEKTIGMDSEPEKLDELNNASSTLEDILETQEQNENSTVIESNVATTSEIAGNQGTTTGPIDIDNGTTTAVEVLDVGTTTETDVGDDDLDVVTSSDVQGTSTATTTEVVGSEPEIPEIDEEQSFQLDSQNVDSISTTTTTSEQLAASTTEEVEEDHVSTPTAVINNSNKYQFSDTECVHVGDGSFYCAKTKADQVLSEREDGVYAWPDKDGDNEIFVVKDGIETQITHNLLEDLAPQYDAKSNKIVWHRLVNDRYQIVSYDLEETKEILLTDTTYNNMEPAAYGAVTVWQSWINNNWEIVVHEDGEVIQLTDNTVHDVAPYVNEDYIIWQSQIGDAWYMSLYDKDTESIERIENTDGAMIENPRFVLVYDAHLGNGDVQTLGYDLETKEIVPLSSTPAPLPDHIPEPEQTGEERALIQNKPPTRDDVLVEDGGNNGNDDPPVPPLASTTATGVESATSTDTATIVIPPVDEAVSTSTVTVQVPEELFVEISEEANTLSEIDESTSTPEVAHIEDIVIPPLTEETAE